MSLSCTFFNEFRPFFALFDVVARSARALYPFPVTHHHFALFDSFVRSHHLTLDLSEQDNDYIVEAEVPGVKKENLEVRVGDNGHSLTIEGKILARAHHSNGNGKVDVSAAEQEATASNNGNGDASNSNEVTKSDFSAPTVFSSKRNLVSSSHFTRTIWHPRAVEASKINATLQDGILTLHTPKIMEDQCSFGVQVK